MTSAGTTDPIAEDWQRFASLDMLGNHWDRPGWTPGRRSYHWLLTFDQSTELHELAARCQARLRFPTLDPVAPDGLHLTLQRLAITDEVTAAEVDKATGEARAELAGVAPFTIGVGPLAGSSGAVRFSVDPWLPVVGVRERLISATGSALGPEAVVTKPHGFRPHVGIAYCNTPSPAAPIVEAVSVLRSLPRVQVTVDAVDLVELRREDRAYRWENVARLPLSGPPLDPPLHQARCSPTA